ncbi:hypothetical protein OPV22_011195 [Ensete ventricosum]|uniref:Uncharacterized protein n=1 Tax=Ensete ventricosum TaxID=4639 RepID=A0AAV8RJY8_ENSVE|nr:hypothetical protein OPV22_011195 [Ensete ventricosum]
MPHYIKHKFKGKVYTPRQYGTVQEGKPYSSRKHGIAQEDAHVPIHLELSQPQQQADGTQTKPPNLGLQLQLTHQE